MFDALASMMLIEIVSICLFNGGSPRVCIVLMCLYQKVVIFIDGTRARVPVVSLKTGLYLRMYISPINSSDDGVESSLLIQ